MSAKSHHEEWLSLVEVSGPFLSPVVLDRVFPSGLPALDREHLQELRLAHSEWSEATSSTAPETRIHDQWLWYVLSETLGFDDDVLIRSSDLSDDLRVEVPEHAEETLVPDFAVVQPNRDPRAENTRMLVKGWPRQQALDESFEKSAWAADPIERMIHHCRSTGVRLGLVTNGERWILVDAPVGETSATVTWYGHLWLEEPLTLRAFQALLGLQRFFGVAEEDRLEEMLKESTAYQAEVTEQLGAQVRRAVEVLVQALDKADADTGRKLLEDVSENDLYLAAVTVMMRLVFLFSAEERDLLLLGHPLYDQYYAVSPLRGQLREAADRLGVEVLERRQDSWCRLLATFRAIYGGVDLDPGEEDDRGARIPAYGGSLFDPDKYPFLEGRDSESTWTEAPATPLPVDNRTVLLLLESLQLLQSRRSGEKGARRLSFRALDIEQIGHVYESLLDHRAVRATETMVSLDGNQGLEPELPVNELTRLREEDPEGLVDYLNSEMKKSKSAIKNALDREPQPEFVGRLRTACAGDEDLLQEVLPFHDLIREDPWGEPVVIREGSVYVTEGQERRATGTYYTPRALTEEIVEHALTPLAYEGPSEGADPDDWNLRRPATLMNLRVCDPAMGSGAFLVQVCRWLSERLVESWESCEIKDPMTIDGQPSSGVSAEILVPDSREERLSLARRLVAERCIYGVDVNPLAVEMAKMSIWLVTLDKDTAFTFLDHALKCGDSLLGTHNIDQIRSFHLKSKRGRILHGTLIDNTSSIEGLLDEIMGTKELMTRFVVRDKSDTDKKNLLYSKIDKKITSLRVIGDAIVAAYMEDEYTFDQRLVTYLDEFNRVSNLADIEGVSSFKTRLQKGLDTGKPSGEPLRRPFHWAIEFSEIFSQGGFSAVVMNPPFRGGHRIATSLGKRYRTYLEEHLAHGKSGRADLSAFFILRASQICARGGVIATLATRSISRGDSRRIGLKSLLDDEWLIYRADPARKWPGIAAVEIALLWMTQDWSGRVFLDGRSVKWISAYLDSRSIAGKPQRLSENENLCFEGHKPYGTGFLIEPFEAEQLFSLDESNREVVLPFLSGSDLNRDGHQRPSRYAIFFRGWPLERAQEYPDCLEIVRQRVKPQRDRLKYKTLREKWWQFGATRSGLREAMKGMTSVMVATKHCKYVSVSFAPSGWLFSHALNVFCMEDMYYYGLLNSEINFIWVSSFSSTLKSDIRYTSSAGFETLVRPAGNREALRMSSSKLMNLRNEMMMEYNIGLTELLNRAKGSRIPKGRFGSLRKVHIQVDRMVADAYQWEDLDLDYSYQNTRWGSRYTLSPKSRSEILDRLLLLNKEHASGRFGA